MRQLIFIVAFLAGAALAYNWANPNFGEIRQAIGLLENRTMEIEKAVGL